MFLTTTFDKYWNNFDDLYYSLFGDSRHILNEEIIKEKEDEFLIKITKLALKREFLKTILEGDKLKVRYDLPKETKLDDFECDSFEKVWKVPRETKKENIKVKYEGGILTIAIKKQIPSNMESVEIPIE